ncbi:dihydrolipoyl dehydrogenase [Thermosediminibacter oceani]|uniref:Dihydrolipoyl dehydrogenase n=1 Tax=Thermosediminibacter oceani (strain ATCC BAA-1034 / DSM 16646 / JW/IW-1228P) TaxID=555079 RepID=D9RXV8_THEOJ|nr:dihydrolipoyl dehydrogenase [Thermosediminibacter oceani]ADL08182.1 dihydrolipoamide dehydrogenase [Thermosediminibacter oceani DSM 16646]
MHYDIVVIGGGPGGYVSAIYAAKKGARVGLVEKRDLGGTCLNRGCIPTKALSHCAQIYQSLGNAKNFGILAENVKIDWQLAQGQKDSIVRTLGKGVENLLKANGVSVFRGEAKLEDERRIRIYYSGGQQVITAENIILATGSKPAVIPFPGHDLPGVITSEEALALSKIPDSMLVIGGGVIGVEMACIYGSIGSNVTVVELLPRILPRADEEISSEIKKVLQSKGIKVLTGTRVESVEKEKDLLKVNIITPDGPRSIAVEKVLVAVGRKPDLEAFEDLNIDLDKSGVIVDDFMRTSLKNVYAVGDITGKFQLAHVAAHQGIVAASNALGENKRMDYRAVPSCIFTNPEIAYVGLTESEAREIYGDDIRVGRFPFVASGRALTLGESLGFVKIVADSRWNEILGVHIIGPGATELIAEAALAIRLECTAQELADTIHAHPTLSETIMEAAMDLLGTPIHKM